MFIRIDRDLVINTANILGYQILEDSNSYKLQIWSTSGALVYNIIYLKDDHYQTNILIEFNNYMRGLTVNAEPPLYINNEEEVEENTNGES